MYAPPHDQLPHGLLFRGVHRVEAEVEQRPEQTGPTGRRQPGGAALELGEQVEDTGRHRPAKCQKTAEFRTGVVGDDQGALADRERRLSHRQEFVLPDAKPAFGEKLLTHHTDRRRAFTGRGVKLKVDAPDGVEVAEPVHDHASPRSRLRTEWSRLSM